MSTPTTVANAELAKVLRDNEDYVLSVTKSKAVDLSEKMFQSCLISDSMMDQFSSLDHSRVDPKLQLRYLFRLVNRTIQQDESVGDKFLGLLENWREQPLCEYLKNNISGEKQPEVKRIRLDDHLRSDDISWILEVLVDASHKWKSLAIALGLRTYQRHNIEGDDNIDKLTKVLDVWLSGGCTKPPTVNKLIDALRSKLVGQGRLVLELEEQYKANQTAHKTSNSNICDVSCLPFTIVYQNPREVNVDDGKSTILIVKASHRENTSYLWYKNGQVLADNTSSEVVNQSCYSGVHEDMLFINHAHQGTQGEYTCCVSNEERQVVSNKVTLTVLYTPEKKILLDKYSSVNTRVPVDEEWPPVGAETFINLALVKSTRAAIDSSFYFINRNPTEVLDNNEKAEYQDVFIAYSGVSFCLIEGRPGSGKTTLVCKLIKDWAEGIVLAQAKLVFLVSLRTLIHDPSQNNTLSEMLQQFYSSCDTLKAVVLDLERSNGEGVCFVFDGLDEYHPDGVDESVVFRILHRRYLSQAMIIVSSRPGAMARLRQEVVTQHIEVLGFTGNQISEYIDKYPFNSSSDSSFGPSQLKEYLRLHPNVLYMCYLPIHAAIICFVYNIKNGHLPDTQTKIYEEFTKSMILRHLKRNNMEVQLYSLKELPDSVRDHFSMLCFIALYMTLAFKLVINFNEVSFLLGIDTSLPGDWSLGLVTCNRTAQLSGISTSYIFLHQTLQEFLAAYYMTSAPEEKKYELIYTLISKSSFALNFERVWTFCFGLETFQSQKELTIYREILKNPAFKFSNCTFRYAFESQQQIMCDDVIRFLSGRIVMTHIKPSDVPVVKFIVSETTQPIREIELLELPSDNVLSELFEQIRHVKLPELETLVLLGVSANPRTLQNLSTILGSCGHLRRFELCLNYLTYEQRDIVADGTIFNDSGSLSIAKNPAFQTLSNQIHRLTQLKRLGLSYCILDTRCCEVLASNLCHLIIIEELFLTNNKISSEGAITLVSALQQLSKLKVLNLNYNAIDSEGAISLVSALHHLTELKHLSLKYNAIGSDGAISLASAFHHLTKLEYLDLNHNAIGSEGAFSLASALHHLTNLNV